MTRASRSALFAVIGQWARYSVQLLSLVLFTRLLTPTDFGLIAQVTAITGVAWVLGDFGLSLAALQKRELSAGQQTNLFWLNLGLGAAIASVLVACGPLIAAFYGDDRLAPIAAVVSLTFLFNGFGTQFKIHMNREMLLGRLVTIETVAQIVGFGAGLSIIIMDRTYWGLVVAPVVTAAVQSFGYAASAHLRIGRPRANQQMRSLLSFGMNTFWLQLLNYVSTNVDSISLGRLQSVATVGLYSRAFQLSTLPMQQLAAPLTRVVLPVLSRAEGDNAQFLLKVRRVQSAFNVVALGALSFLAACAPSLIPIVLGDRWVDASLLLQVLCVAAAFQAMSYVYYWVLLAKGRTGLLFWSELFPRLVGIVLVIWAAHLGAVEVAVASMVSQILMWLVGAVYAMRKVGLPAGVLLLEGLRPMAVFGAGVAVALFARAVAPEDANAWLQLAIVAGAWTAAVTAFALVPRIRADLLGPYRMFRPGRPVSKPRP